MQEAEADLKGAEKKWEVIDVDDEEDVPPPGKKQKQGPSEITPPGNVSRQIRPLAVLLKYPLHPFTGEAPSALVDAAAGMKELNGHLRPEANQSAAGAGIEGHILSSGENQIFIRQSDKEKLSPGQHLSNPLVDFWMRW